MTEQPFQETIAIKSLVQKLFAHWYYFAIAVPIALVIAFAYIWFSPKVYEVNASLLLTDKSNTGAQGDLAKTLDILRPKTELEDEIGVLSSFSLAKETVGRMDLGVSYFSVKNFKTHVELYNMPFEVVVDSTRPQYVYLPFSIKLLGNGTYQIKASGEKVHLYDLKKNELVREMEEMEIDETLALNAPTLDKYGFSIKFKPDLHTYKTTKYKFHINTLDALAEGFQSSLKVASRSEESNILELSMEGTVVEIDKKYINTLLEVYFEKELEKMSEKGKKSLEFIDNRITAISDSLRLAENERERIRTGGVLDIGTTIRTRQVQLITMEEEQYRAAAKAKYYQQILNTMKDGDGLVKVLSPSTANIEDPVLNNMLLDLSKLNNEYAEAKTSIRTPKMRKEIENRIIATRDRIIQSVSQSVSLSEIALGGLNSKIGSIRGELRSIPQTEKELESTLRVLTVLDRNYNSLLEKRHEVELAMASSTVDKEIIDKARLTQNAPVSPKKSLILLIAMMVGMGIPFGLVIMKDFFNDKIDSHSDVETKTAIPILGYIAKASKEKSLITLPNAPLPLVESFRAVQVHMKYLFTDGDKKVIGVTSSISGEGKTFCSTNLSLTLAKSGNKTLMIDVDLRKPRLAEYYESRQTGGLSTYLAGKHDLNEVIEDTNIENLDIIPSGPVPSNPLDLLGNERMKNLIDKLKDHYDYIILDTPPLGLVSDYLILRYYTDFNIYVVRHGHTQVRALERINELYETKKIDNLCILMNDIKPGDDYGGYGGTYGVYPYQN